MYARWVAQATNAINATYTIAPNTAGSTPTVITVNQQVNGGTWNYLGTVNLNTANQMTVTLSGQGNGIVIADAIKIVPNTASATQTNAYNLYTDHLNTPRLISNYANQQRWTWYPEQSGAFGDGLPNDNPNNTVGGQLGAFTYNLRFPGQLYDAASGLSYNYYRDYNSRTGRYIESDPIGLAGGINTYAYVGGNPLSRIDPDGLRYVCVGIIPFVRCYYEPPTLGPLGIPDSASGSSSLSNPLSGLVDKVKEMCEPEKRDCQKEWEADVAWCDARWSRYSRKGEACHRWAEGNFDRCRKGSSREPWRL